ncbi:MAG TPA: TolC family protein [Gemmatimonadales bacterium]|nr:TolC family protein [Gemmatimonadales bacterium]
MRRLIVALVMAVPSVLRAQQQPLRLTMEEAVRRAVDQGEEMRLARAQLAQAQGAVTQAYAEALPELRASLTYTRTFASVFSGGQGGPALDPYAPDTTAPISDRVRYLEREYDNMLPRGLSRLFAATPFGRENSYVWQLTLRQTLFRGGVVGAGVRGARAYERAARAGLEETRHDVAYRTRRAYLNALFAQRLLEIAEGSRALSAEQLRRVELNHRVGTSADYDLLRSQVEYANTEPAVIAARNDRDLAFLELRRLVNVPAETPLELDATVLAAQESLPEVDLEALSADLGSRASLEAAQWTVNFRREAVRVYRGELMPALRFQMNYGGQAFPSGALPGGGDFRRDWNASLTVSMPLFDGFRTRGQVASARADLEAAELQLEAAREAVALEVEQARAELVRARALVEARRQTVQWAARAYQLASVRYANGISTQLEVSDARLAMQQAQVNEAAATRDYLLSLAALERALGRPVPLQRAQRAASRERGAGLSNNPNQSEHRH